MFLGDGFHLNNGRMMQFDVCMNDPSLWNSAIEMFIIIINLIFGYKLSWCCSLWLSCFGMPVISHVFQSIIIYIYISLRLHGMSWAVKTTCFKAPGVSLGSGVSIGGVRSLRDIIHYKYVFWWKKSCTAPKFKTTFLFTGVNCLWTGADLLPSNISRSATTRKLYHSVSLLLQSCRYQFLGRYQFCAFPTMICLFFWISLFQILNTACSWCQILGH